MVNSKRKGKRGEREFAAFCREHGFGDCRRGQQYHGLEGEDIVNLPGHHVEVKRAERFNVYKALQQAIDDASEGRRPIVAYKKNRQPWVVVVLAEDYLRGLQWAKVLQEEHREGGGEEPDG